MFCMENRSFLEEMLRGMSPHQRTIDRIARRLRKSLSDSKIFTNVGYDNVVLGEEGECDILALCGFYSGKRKYALIFEVKSSKTQEHKQKAIEQLEKDERDVKAFYGEDVRCFKFSVYTSNNYFRNSKWVGKPYDIVLVRKKKD